MKKARAAKAQADSTQPARPRPGLLRALAHFRRAAPVKKLARLPGWTKATGVSAVAALALAACGSSAPAASSAGASGALTPLKFAGPANPPPGVTPIPAGFAGYAIYLGEANKVLKPYGFSYQGNLSFENTTEADAALQSGSAQLVAQGQAPAILAKAGGDDFTVIGAGADPDTTWVMVKKGSPITSIKQLAGKTVGAGFGTNFEQGFLWGLNQAGLSPKSAKLANIVVNDGGAALQNGQDGIAAFATSTQLGQLWQKSYGDVPIWKSQDYPADQAAQVVLVQSSFAKAHPKIQAAWWALYQAGLAAYKKDPAKFFAEEAQQNGITPAQAKIADPVVIQSTPIEPSAVTVLSDGLKFFVSVGQAADPFSVSSWLIAPAGTIKK